MKDMLSIIIGLVCVFGVLFKLINTIRIEARIEKEKKTKAERETRSKMKLQKKVDEFNKYKSYIEDAGDTCAECYAYDYVQYIKCHQYDHDGLLRHKINFNLEYPCPKKQGKTNLSSLAKQENTSYIEAHNEIGEKPIRNLRVQLSDFTVEEVEHLFSF